MIKPPKLHRGDTIGLLATARKVTPAELQPAIDFLENAGYKVMIPNGLYSTEFQFAGSDFSRAQDLQMLANHPEVKAIWCVRGGYGTVRLMDKINLAALRENPKWFIGFSDVTVLLSRLYQEGIMGAHGPMAINFSTEDSSSGFYILPEKRQKLLSFLDGSPVNIEIIAHPMNTFEGICTGKLFGGNLSVMMSLSGSKEDVRDADIYIIEDLDEYLYHFDRMIQWLFRSGKLQPGKPLLVGHLNDMKNLNPDNPFGKTAEEIISDAAKKNGIPVIFGLPFGHLPENDVFVTGANYRIEALDGLVRISEIPSAV